MNGTLTKTLFFVLTVFASIQSNAQCVGRDKNGYYLIDRGGEKRSEAYDFIQNEHSGTYLVYSSMYLVYKNGKFGYIDYRGNCVIPLIYDVAYPFNGKFALVGKNAKYYHINTANQVLDSMDWPKAPLVYRERFLLANENGNKVFYENGTEVLHSDNPLLLAKESGIIVWNAEKDSVYQFTSLYDTKDLKLTKTYASEEVPGSTSQGYVYLSQTVEGRKKYLVYDESGQLVVNCDAEGVTPEDIRVLWNKYVALKGYTAIYGDPVERRSSFRGSGTEIHYDMSELLAKGANYRGQYAFLLCEKYANDKMALLKNTDKWIAFDGSRIRGHYLFDEVTCGDQRYTPVKIDRKWYLYHRDKDSLIPLPYRDIHPAGMNNGRFFASNQDGSLEDERWFFVNFSTGTVSTELCSLPLSVDENAMDNYSKTYYWNVQMNEVMKHGRRTLIDNKGETIWTDSAEPPVAIDDFLKVGFAFKTGNYLEIQDKQTFKKNAVSLVLKQQDSGIRVLLANTKKTQQVVEVQDGYFQAVVEMKTAEGKWKIIGRLPPSDCGNSYYASYFPAQRYTSTTLSLPKGDQWIVIRIVLDAYSEQNRVRVVSNELRVKTNPGRTWVEEYCKGFGCERP